MIAHACLLSRPYDDVLNRLSSSFGCPTASSEIPDAADAVGQEMLDRPGIRIGEIGNLDEVAQAGSITPIIIKRTRFSKVQSGSTKTC